jgi:hypothetical protein
MGISDDPNIEWVDTPCDPIGRGSTEIPNEEFIFREGINPGNCSIKRTLIILSDGRVQPCCGTGGLSQSLTLGNLRHAKLVDIIHDMESNPLINALVMWKGPYLLATLLEKAGFHGYLTGPYTSACHACYSMLSNTRTAKYLKRLLESKKIELLAARLLAEQQINTKSKQGSSDSNR